jgi:hypothetical protein
MILWHRAVRWNVMISEQHAAALGRDLERECPGVSVLVVVYPEVVRVLVEPVPAAGVEDPPGWDAASGRVGDTLSRWGWRVVGDVRGRGRRRPARRFVVVRRLAPGMLDVGPLVEAFLSTPPPPPRSGLPD